MRQLDDTVWRDDKMICVNLVPAQGESTLNDAQVVYEAGCVFRDCGQLISELVSPGSLSLFAQIPTLYNSELSRLLYEIAQLGDECPVSEQENAFPVAHSGSPRRTDTKTETRQCDDNR